MAEAPKKPPARPGAVVPILGKAKKSENPLVPVIAIGLILGGVAWMTFSIITKPAPVKKKGGGH